MTGRSKQLRKGTVTGECVLYVMSRDQRVDDNHALIEAQQYACNKKLPLAVVFCLRGSKSRAREHYDFMMSGLREVEHKLATLGIPFMMLIGNPEEKIKSVIHHTKPDAIFFDLNPLRGPRQLLLRITNSVACSVFVVDTHNIVPVWYASDKCEVAAYTLRPKLHKQLATWLTYPEKLITHPFAWPGIVRQLSSLDGHIASILNQQKMNGIHVAITPGELAAKNHLSQFIKNKLVVYGTDRNDPNKDAQSMLSAYLHFGHISSLRIVLRMQELLLHQGQDLHLLQSPKMPQPHSTMSHIRYSVDAFVEELVVRKELADNFCYYATSYDTVEAAPNWAIKSLDKHRADHREYTYSYKQLDQGLTHDVAWNAAQKQLTTVGRMHGYMRMYWAKKVLEWTESVEQAIGFLIQLNDFYSLDGGDPNGYAGIMWSVAGVHDRPWAEREIFGVIRYMNYQGLKRKFDRDEWVRQILA